MADGGDRERGAVQDADCGIAQAVDALGVQIVFDTLPSTRYTASYENRLISPAWGLMTCSERLD